MESGRLLVETELEACISLVVEVVELHSFIERLFFEVEELRLRLIMLDVLEIINVLKIVDVLKLFQHARHLLIKSSLPAFLDGCIPADALAEMESHSLAFGRHQLAEVFAALSWRSSAFGRLAG